MASKATTKAIRAQAIITPFMKATQKCKGLLELQGRKLIPIEDFKTTATNVTKLQHQWLLGHIRTNHHQLGHHKTYDGDFCQRTLTILVYSSSC